MMGIDIDGWIEVATELSREALLWMAVVKVEPLLNRNYDAFGCLFGVANFAHFQPIAAHRGIPFNASETVYRDFVNAADDSEDDLFPTWITWSEIHAINWEEESVHPDSRLHQYRRNEQGEFVYETKAVWSSNIAQLIGRSLEDVTTQPPIWSEGQEWVTDDYVLRAEKLCRCDVWTDDWRRVFKIMELLAEQFGDQQVRLVVWFDR
jgi:hypothetical protein